jgi:hypothetical protein
LKSRPIEIHLDQGSLKLEGWAGIEPANTGFADPRVSHFATSPFNDKLTSCCDCLQIWVEAPKSGLEILGQK